MARDEARGLRARRRVSPQNITLREPAALTRLVTIGDHVVHARFRRIAAEPWSVDEPDLKGRAASCEQRERDD
jgi:hypothetical protein